MEIAFGPDVELMSGIAGAAVAKGCGAGLRPEEMGFGGVEGKAEGEGGCECDEKDCG